ncbi:MAG TPA: hypothetical protein VHC49_11515 [Mycobacteriales bacterium]|nr:hypothetical protein [Mycobacteriales bacterium]
MNEFAVHPQLASDQGWQFSMLASDISHTLQWYESNMSVLGDYVGTDSAGQRFKAAYQPKLDIIEPALRALIQDLYGLGTTLDRLGRESEQHDTANARTIHRTHRH